MALSSEDSDSDTQVHAPLPASRKRKPEVRDSKKEEGTSDLASLEEDEERIVLEARAQGDFEDELSSDEDEDDGRDENGNVNVDFEFRDPKEDDFFMVKSLMQQGITGLLPGMTDLLSQLTEDICTQAACGTTIAVDGEVYSFISALGANHYHDQPYMEAMRALLESTCPPNMKPKLEKELSSGFAWLLSERLVNMPNEVVPPLYQAIIDDIEWARENVKETGGTKEMFDFKNVVFFAPCYTDSETAKINNESDGEESDEEDQVNTKRSKKTKSSQDLKIESISKNVLYFEHESLMRKSILSFPITLATPSVIEGKAKGAVPQRHKPKQAIAIVLPLDQLKANLESVQKMLTQ